MLGSWRIIEDLGHGPRLDDAACPHHRDAVAHILDDVEIVGNEQHRQTKPHLEGDQEIQNLGLRDNDDIRIRRCRRPPKSSEQLLKDVTAAGLVHIFNHTVRRRVLGVADAPWRCGPRRLERWRCFSRNRHCPTSRLAPRRSVGSPRRHHGGRDTRHASRPAHRRRSAVVPQ